MTREITGHSITTNNGSIFRKINFFFPLQYQYTSLELCKRTCANEKLLYHRVREREGNGGGRIYDLELKIVIRYSSVT
jgi:hypothetical protein